MKKAPFVLALLLVFSAAAMSQSFGRNKVRYESFDFRMLKSEHFDVLFYGNIEETADKCARLLERWNIRIRALLDHSLSARQQVILYESHTDFQQTNAIPGLISQGVGGVTEGKLGRIVLPLSPSNTQNEHVLGHELVHGFHYDMIDRSSDKLGFTANVPLWFVEGLAEYATLGPDDAQTAMWLRDAVLRDDIPSIRAPADMQKYNPYRFGHAVWAYIGSEYGDDKIASLYRRTLQMGFGRAAKGVLGVSVDELTEGWHRDIVAVAEPELSRRERPEDVGSSVLPDRSGTMLSPSLGNEGRYIAFFSQRDVFSLALTIADLDSGRVLGSVSTFGANRHFDQLKFTGSSGAFSPTDDRFAFIIQRKGDNGIALAKIPDLEINRTLFFDEIGTISHIAWNPDGTSLVVAASKNGKAGLFRIDLRDGTLSVITSSEYSVMQPAFSPDGKRIVYVTDRGNDTSLDDLSFGAMKLAVRNMETDEERLISLPGAKTHISPHFSSVGDSLYFVADPDGVPNIFRYHIDSGSAVRLTNIATGVSSMTDLAPALSVAGDDDTAVFSVFTERSYRFRTSELADAARETATGDAQSHDASVTGVDSSGRASGDSLRAVAETALRPGAHLTRDSLETSIVASYLRDDSGVPATGEDFEIEEYRPSLELADVGQAGFGVSLSRFGASVYGRVNLSFSDLLGNHALSAFLQLGGSTLDIGGEAVYINRRSRLGWGLAAAHMPYQSAETTISEEQVTLSDGTEVTADVREQVINRVFIDHGQLLGELPLSRNLRFEAVAGYTRYSFLKETETVAIVNGTRIFERSEIVTPEDPLNLFNGGLAFVGDYSFLGFTGPLQGSRFRAEIDTAVGSLSFLNAKADYRHYLFFKPVGLAFQLFHSGQYLQNDTEGLIAPLNLGSSFYVRGYYPGSYTTEECGDSTTDCPDYQRIFGSRIVAAKAELRLPLLGTEQLGLLPFRFLPTTLFGFFDAGLAWFPDDPPAFMWATDTDLRVPVAGVGGGARFNILGGFVLQLYYVYPFQRPNRGGYVNAVLEPGF